MVDVVRVRELRDQIRTVIGLKEGEPITDEMLSATMASIVEAWTLRIFCSPEKHTSLSAVDLMKRVSDDMGRLLQRQAQEFLPHAKTFSFFRDPKNS